FCLPNSLTSKATPECYDEQGRCPYEPDNNVKTVRTNQSEERRTCRVCLPRLSFSNKRSELVELKRQKGSAKRDRKNKPRKEFSAVFSSHRYQHQACSKRTSKQQKRLRKYHREFE